MDTMDKKPGLKAQLQAALLPAAQLAFALLLLVLATERFALDIHIGEPGQRIWVQLTVADRSSASTYSFCLPPLPMDKSGGMAEPKRKTTT